MNLRTSSLLSTIIIFLILIGGFALIYLIDGITNEQPYNNSNLQELKKNSVPVTKIIDGDTLEVVDDESEIKLRLLGVDTPEIGHPQDLAACFAKEAKAVVVELLAEEEIYYDFDPSQPKLDQYGRNLVYVWRASDDLFINEFLLKEGYANFYQNRTPIHFDQEFRDWEEEARTANIGLWGDACN